MTGVSRRTVIAGSALAAVSAATAIGTKRWWPELGSADGPFPTTGKPYCMAMHVHSSFSEGPGSMEAQLDQAVRSGVDVIWWTEHDHRMRAHGYQRQVTFGAQVERENDLIWRWIPSVQGKPRATRRFGPLAEPPPGRSRARGLRLGVAGTGKGTVEHRLTGQAENDRYRTSLDGQVLEIDIFPVTVTAASYLAIEILSSHRPRRNGRPAGRYRLSYRIGGSSRPTPSARWGPASTAGTPRCSSSVWWRPPTARSRRSRTSPDCVSCGPETPSTIRCGPRPI
jgi:hypothetical protein